MNFDWITQGEYGSGPDELAVDDCWDGAALAFCLRPCHLLGVHDDPFRFIVFAFVCELAGAASTIVALVMMGVGQQTWSLAFGMMAVFAIVRFRNILRDTLDTTLHSHQPGHRDATGTFKFASALIGCALVSPRCSTSGMPILESATATI